MTKVTPGYLYKKDIIVYKSKRHDVLKPIDYAAALYYDEADVCEIINGDYINALAAGIDIADASADYIFAPDVLADAKDDNDFVSFEDIRVNKLCELEDYYELDDDKSLIPVTDKRFIRFIRRGEKEENASLMNITDMNDSIKETIVAQDDQIVQVLATLYKNQKVVNSNLDEDTIRELKENILICGSTGTGKTEILKRISRMYNIPIVIEDATTLSETGYVGKDVSNMIEDLIAAADYDINLAERGILVIDEIDKLAEANSGDEFVSRSGVQRSLLKLLDGNEFHLKGEVFDSSKLTVVGLGAFAGAREFKKPITVGFNSNLNASVEEQGKMSTQDLMDYGLMGELVGRFSKIITMNRLCKEDLIKILVESNASPINTYQKLFDDLKINFEYDDEFVEWMAEEAEKLNTGARSLKKTFDELIGPAMYDILAGNYDSISMVKPNEDKNEPFVLSNKQKVKVKQIAARR